MPGNIRYGPTLGIFNCPCISAPSSPSSTRESREPCTCAVCAQVMLVGGGVLCYGVKDVILDTMRVRGVAVRTAARQRSDRR